MILQPGERSAASDLNKSIAGARKEASKLQDIFGVSGPLTRDMSLRMGETAQSVFRLREGLLESTNLTERIQNIGATIFVSMQENASNTNTALTDAVSKLIQKVKLSNDSNDVERQVLENIRDSSVVQREITKEAVNVFNTRQSEKSILEELFKDQKEQFKLIKEDRDARLKELDRTREELKNEKDSLKREQLSRDLQKQISDLQLVEYNLSLKGAETGEIRLKLAQATEAASLSIQDIQSQITSDLEKQVIGSVKLATNYADLQDLTQNIQDSQVANANIVSKLASLESNRALEAFKEKNKLKDASEAEILNRFQLNQLNQGLALAEEKRKKLLEESGGVVTDEVDLIDDIIRSTRREINLNIENIDKLELIRQLEEEIKEEKEKQSIIDKVKLDLGNKFTELLGNQGEEVLEIGHALKESMVSPLALIGALLGSALEEFMKLGVESRKFLDSTKLTVSQTEHVRHLAHDISLEYRAQGVEMENVLNATGALVDKYGSLNRVSDEAIEKVTLLGKAFGISEENAAGVMYQIQASTGASAETAGNIAALGAQFAAAAGVAPDAVMADIAKSSEQIATYFKGTPQDLLRTAVEARRLGLDIGKVADISKTLLNFESSIEDQMTASVLLGREINLDKARQLAMEGKIEEAAKETLNQIGDLASFNKMNAVQKEAIAKAAGLTVAELQQSLEKQDAINNMTAAQRAEYEKNLNLLNQGNESAADRLLKEQRNQLTQEKIADAVAKIADIFANVILPVLEPIFDLISGIFSFIEPALPYLKTGLQIFLGYKLAAFLLNTEFFKTRGLLGTFAAPFQMIGKGLTSARDGVVNLYKSTKDWLTKSKEGDGIWKSLKDKLTGLGPTLKSFFLGKGPKEWGKEATESFDKASKAGGSFFDKMKGWMEKFSFGPIDEEADDLESTLQDIAKSDLEKMGAEPIESAASTLQEKAQEKISEVVSPESAVESATTTLQDKAQEKGEELVGSVKESFMPDKVAESAEQAQEVEAKMAAAPGEGSKTFLTNLSEGLKAMGQPGVLKGALSLIPAAIGFVAMTPGILAIALVSRLGKGIQTGLEGLAEGLKAMGSPAAIKGGLILSGIALSLGASLLMMGAGLYLAASGMAALVESFKGLTPEQILGAVGAIMALGAGIYFLIPALLTFGTTAGITAGPLLGLGAALLMIGAGVGLAAAGFSLLVTSISSASDEIIKLLENIEVDQLLAIAGGLTAIGLALSTISMFGTMALPALGAIAAISLGAGALFGGGEETAAAPAAAEEEAEGTDNSALIAKMDELIAVITNSTTPIQLVVDGKVMAEAVGRKTERNYQANPRK